MMVVTKFYDAMTLLQYYIISTILLHYFLSLYYVSTVFIFSLYYVSTVFSKSPIKPQHSWGFCSRFSLAVINDDVLIT